MSCFLCTQYKDTLSSSDIKYWWKCKKLDSIEEALKWKKSEELKYNNGFRTTVKHDIHNSREWPATSFSKYYFEWKHGMKYVNYTN